MSGQMATGRRTWSREWLAGWLVAGWLAGWLAGLAAGCMPCCAALCCPSQALIASPLWRHACCACRDGKLVTGQNPQSSQAVAEAVIALVTPPLKEPVHGKGEGEGFHHRWVAAGVCKWRAVQPAS